MNKNSFIYKVGKQIRDKYRLRGRYGFINRSQGKKKLCILLCGYKEFLWEEYFFRLKKYSSQRNSLYPHNRMHNFFFP